MRRHSLTFRTLLYEEIVSKSLRIASLIKSGQITSVLKKDDELKKDTVGTYFFIPCIEIGETFNCFFPEAKR